MKDKMPAHVAARRATKDRAEYIVDKEPHDVFKRINMHDGDKEPCWEWNGAHNVGTGGEYRPRVRVGDTEHYVYRVVYQLYTGHKLAKGEVVRHSCDNSWCCNPHHMAVGTQLDNVRDMLERERVGLKLFHIKRIMQMFEIGCTAEFIHRKMIEGYNVRLDVSVIRKIRMRTVYKHIEWKWGDEYAARRRKKNHRLASVSSTAIIGDTATDKGE